jgi:hypothetical protein
MAGGGATPTTAARRSSCCGSCARCPTRPAAYASATWLVANRRSSARKYHEHPVDEYEVLLDEATWERAEWIEKDDGSCWEDIARNGLACGRTADGTPLYVTLRDREGEGYQPGENQARANCDFSRMVLNAPVGAPATDDAPRGAPVGPRAVVSALDCKNEVVEIANTGDAELDLGGWKLHDEGSRKG